MVFPIVLGAKSVSSYCCTIPVCTTDADDCDEDRWDNNNDEEEHNNDGYENDSQSVNDDHYFIVDDDTVGRMNQRNHRYRYRKQQRQQEQQHPSTTSTSSSIGTNPTSYCSCSCSCSCCYAIDSTTNWMALVTTKYYYNCINDTDIDHDDTDLDHDDDDTDQNQNRNRNRNRNRSNTNCNDNTEKDAMMMMLMGEVHVQIQSITNSNTTRIPGKARATTATTATMVYKNIPLKLLHRIHERHSSSTNSPSSTSTHATTHSPMSLLKRANISTSTSLRRLLQQKQEQPASSLGEEQTNIKTVTAATGIPKNQVYFTPDHQYLICLLVHPNAASITTTKTLPKTTTTIVVFDLQQQEESAAAAAAASLKYSSPPPPLPSYIQDTISTDSSTTRTSVYQRDTTTQQQQQHHHHHHHHHRHPIPSATNPKTIVVQHSDRDPYKYDQLHNGSTICTVTLTNTNANATRTTNNQKQNATRTTTSTFMIVLIGCSNGNIYMATAPPQRQDDYDNGNNNNNNNNGSSIHTMMAFRCTKYDDTNTDPTSYNNNDNIENDSDDNNWIVQMDHTAHANDNVNNNDDTTISNGKLLVLYRNGRLQLFHTQFYYIDDMNQNHTHNNSKQIHYNDRSKRNGSSITVPPQHNTMMIGMILYPIYNFYNNNINNNTNYYSNQTTPQTTSIEPLVSTININFISVKWIPYSCSKFIAVQEPNTECTVQVYGLYYNNSNSNETNSIDTTFVRVHAISTMVMTQSLLEESIGSSILFDQYNQKESMDTCIGYDPYCDCFAITSYLTKKLSSSTTTKTLSKQEQQQQYYYQSFSCLWSWRQNILGYTTTTTATNVTAWNAHIFNTINTNLPSKLFFGWDDRNRKKLYYCTTTNGTLLSSTPASTIRLVLEMYDVAVLSPPNNICNHYIDRTPKISESNSLLLSATSISYPNTIQQSNLIHNYEMEWTESNIPKSYISMYGVPQIATIGTQYHRSIAIASSRGFCVLDRHMEVVGSNSSRNRNNHSRWRLFSNTFYESQFRVIAFTWWEGVSTTNLNPAHTDDILVAVIEVVGDKEWNGYYISCWSAREIDLSTQLVTDDVLTGSKWGVRLPHNFIPTRMDVLSCPFQAAMTNTSALSDGLATLLVSDSSSATNYRIYQLHHRNKPNRQNVVSKKRQNSFSISCRCTAHGCINYPSDVFVASASFSGPGSNHDSTRIQEIEDEITTLGSIRHYGGGLETLLVSSTNIVAVGKVIEADPTCSEISRYWRSDIICEKKRNGACSDVNLIHWVIQLASGRLVNWTVLFGIPLKRLVSQMALHQVTETSMSVKLVQPNSLLLGLVTPAGSTANWMQQSSSGVQCDFLCGSIPYSSFGSVVGVSQNFKKMKISTDDNVDLQCFRPSVLQHTMHRTSDFQLYPPRYLPSFHVQAIETLPPLDYASHYFERHIQWKLSFMEQQGMIALSLQLIVLRLVEKLSQIYNRGNVRDPILYSRLDDRLASTIAIIRNNTTPLQFTTFFLSLGRHMEPSCMNTLFPLPETINDLFYIAIAYGSISTAVSTLPILLDTKSTMSYCIDMFHYCVDQFDTAFKPMDNNNLDFDVNIDEFNAMGEIFRYAIKIQDRIMIRNVTNSISGEIYLPDYSEHDSTNDDDDGSNNVSTRSFSMLCGVSNLLGRNRSKTIISDKKFVQHNSSNRIKGDACPVLVHGMTDARLVKLREFGVRHIRKLTLWQRSTSLSVMAKHMTYSNVTQILSRYIVSSIFGGNSYDTQIGWMKVALLSNIIVDDMSPEFFYDSAPNDTFSSFCSNINVNRYISLCPVDIRRGGLQAVLKYYLNNFCIDNVVTDSIKTASHILNLIFVLFVCMKNDKNNLDITPGSKSSSSSSIVPSTDLPGLVLVALIAAHKSHRIWDVLVEPTTPSDDDTNFKSSSHSSSELINTYFELYYLASLTHNTKESGKLL